MQTQILVIGGGPSGLAAALDLAQRGVEVVIVDKGLEPLPGVRAGGVTAEMMEKLRRLGVADKLRARAPMPRGWPGSTVITTRLASAAITTLEPPAWGVRHELTSEIRQNAQSVVLEHVLRDELHTYANATCLFGYTFDGSISDTPDGVDVTVIGPVQESLTIHSRYAIAADGANSRVREALGIRIDGRPAFATRWKMQFAAPGLRQLMGHGRHNQYWALNHDMAAYLLQRDDIDQWTIQIQEASEAFQAHFNDPEATLEQIFGTRIGVTWAETPQRFRANAFWATRLRKGNVFLIGDTAHAMPPGGRGLHLGNGDAANLAWKLADVLNGNAEPALLDSYEAERAGLAQQYALAVPSGPHPVRAAALKEPDLERVGPEGDNARARVAEEAVRRNGARRFGDTIYDTVESAVIAPATRLDKGAVVNGRRLPHRWLAVEDSIFDHLARQLNLVTDQPDSPVTTAFRSAAVESGVNISVLEVPEGTYELPYVLVRPDFVVAWSGTACHRAVELLSATMGSSDRAAPVA